MKVKVLLAIGLAILVVACNGGNGVGGNCPLQTTVAITGLENAAILTRTGADDGTNENTTLVEYSFVEGDQSVPAERLMVSVLTTTVLAELERVSQFSPAQWLANFFMRPANALTCAPPVLESDQRILDLDIVSNAAISVDFPAGSSLSSAFRIRPVYDIPLGQTLHRTYFNTSTAMPLVSEFIVDQPEAPLVLALILDIALQDDSTHVFTVSCKLQNGDVFTIQTDPVQLTAN